MGPSAIRYSGLAEKLRALGHKVQDYGNIQAPLAEMSRIQDSDAKYLSAGERGLQAAL